MEARFKRMLFTLFTFLLVMGGSSSVRADEFYRPVKEEPRKRLGMFLAASYFKYKGCHGVLAQMGENGFARLEYVTDVGFDLTNILTGITENDPAARCQIFEGLRGLLLALSTRE